MKRLILTAMSEALKKGMSYQVLISSIIRSHIASINSLKQFGIYVE